MWWGPNKASVNSMNMCSIPCCVSLCVYVRSRKSREKKTSGRAKVTACLVSSLLPVEQCEIAPNQLGELAAPMVHLRVGTAQSRNDVCRCIEARQRCTTVCRDRACSWYRHQCDLIGTGGKLEGSPIASDTSALAHANYRPRGNVKNVQGVSCCVATMVALLP
jgi:hypothetical protein